MSKLLERFAPEVGRLYNAGAVKAMIDMSPRPQFDSIDITLTMRGFEIYTMETLRRDYKEWRTCPVYIPTLEELLGDRHSKEEAERIIKGHEKEGQELLKQYNTFRKWAVSNEGVGKGIYDKVQKKELIYHLIRYGNLTRIAAPDLLEETTLPIVERQIERQFYQMEETAKRQFVKLDSKMAEEIAKAPRLPGWIFVREVQ
jgi:hypothetical protein